jgi:caa(3)-type oxidase subunit IV
MAHDTHAHDEHAPNVKAYLGVFAALMILTCVTVWISKFHLAKHEAVALGLLVAGVKASLVAAVFMHLWGEKKLIFYALGLTVALGSGLAVALIDSRLTDSRRYGAVDVAAQQPHHHEEAAEHAPEGGAVPASESALEKTAPNRPAAKTKAMEKAKKAGH